MVGSALLLAVVGSGIIGERLAGAASVALLANTIATGAALGLDLTFRADRAHSIRRRWRTPWQLGRCAGVRRGADQRWSPASPSEMSHHSRWRSPARPQGAHQLERVRRDVRARLRHLGLLAARSAVVVPFAVCATSRRQNGSRRHVLLRGTPVTLARCFTNTFAASARPSRVSSVHSRRGGGRRVVSLIVRPSCARRDRRRAAAKVATTVLFAASTTPGGRQRRRSSTLRLIHEPAPSPQDGARRPGPSKSPTLRGAASTCVGAAACLP
jgi:hypothetical protein